MSDDAKRPADCGFAEQRAAPPELTPPAYPTPGPPPPPFADPARGGAGGKRARPAAATAAPVCEKFGPQPRFNDLWAAVLFVGHLAAFAYVAYLGLTSAFDRDPIAVNFWLPTGSDRDPRAVNFWLPTDAFLYLSDTPALLILLFSAFTAFVLSTVYFFLIERFTAVIIRSTLLVAIIVGCALGPFFACYTSRFMLSMVAFAAAFTFAICWFRWRHRFPFANFMLQTAIAVSKKQKGMFASAVFGLCLELLYTVCFVLTLVGIVKLDILEAGTAPFGSSIRLYPRTGKGVGMTLFAIFSFYWVTQVILTVVHVTISGAFAAFYFLEGSPQGLPFSPTISSFKRAVSTSFGSVCFGSLISALLKAANSFLRFVLGTSDRVTSLLTVACGTCLVDAIDCLVQYFSHYTYTQVAIYGKDFCTAAKDTWKLIKDRGVEAIINDCIIGSVLTVGSLVVALLTSLLTLAFVSLSYDGDRLCYLPQYLGVAFLLGFTATSFIGVIVTSGTATTIVALAEDPEALARTKPELYEKVRQTYPEIAVGI